MPRNSYILGIGTAVPAVSITQQAAAAFASGLGCFSAEQKHLVEVLYRRAGVKERGSVLLAAKGSGRSNGTRQQFFPNARDREDRGPSTRERLDRYALEAPPLAAASAVRALEDARLAPDKITHVVTVSCTGFMAPGVDIRLSKLLGLRPDVERTNVGFMGCHGALNGLRAATALASSQAGARVLLCAVELCSLHVRYGWDEEGLVANALFADGAAACVVGASSSRRGEALRVRGTGAFIIPDSEAMMSWQIGNHGFEMRLDPSVPALIAKHLRPWLVRWLASNGLTLETVGSWALHPGGPRILSSVLSGLGLPERAADISRAVLAEHGNMSSPTVLFILDRFRRLGAPRPYVSLAFGPGLAAEAALLE